MQLCQPHFDELANALKLRGLWQYQAATQAEREQMVEAINEEGEVEHFDALIMTQLAIYNEAVEVGGEGLLVVNEKGESLCPICELKAVHWINAATDEVLRYGQEHGLVKRETRQ